MRRTPISRGSLTKKFKCKICRQEFTRMLPNQKVCGADCATDFAVSDRAKKERIETKRLAAIDRANTRTRKDALKSIPEWIAEAQKAFNAYIRARDANLPCICCDKPFQPQKPGGSIDAGHYLSRGSAGHLRFNEDNCFAQRKNCNRPGGTTRNAFRNGVIKRIGIERVEALEGNQEIHKWTVEELKAIKALYINKLKELRQKND